MEHDANPARVETQAEKIAEFQKLMLEAAFCHAASHITDPRPLTEEEIELKLVAYRKHVDKREHQRRRENLRFADKVSDAYPNLKKHLQGKAAPNMVTIYDNGVFLKTQTFEEVRENVQRNLFGLNLPKDMLDMPGEKK